MTEWRLVIRTGYCLQISWLFSLYGDAKNHYFIEVNGVKEDTRISFRDPKGVVGLEPENKASDT